MVVAAAVNSSSGGNVAVYVGMVTEWELMEWGWWWWWWWWWWCRVFLSTTI